MANIDIQKKEGGSFWPWLLGLAVLALLIWAGAEMLDTDDEDFAAVPAEEQQPLEGTTPVDPMATAAMPMEVTAFEEQCASADAAGQMAVGHQYVQGCVQQMAAALAAVVQRDTVAGTALAPQLEDFRQSAMDLTTDAQSMEHAGNLKQVFENAAELVANLEQMRNQAGQQAVAGAAGMEQAANNINVEQPLMEQAESVGMFFRNAAQALRALAA